MLHNSITFDQVVAKLPILLSQQLPGEQAHAELAPLKRKGTSAYEPLIADARKAAVLVIIENGKNCPKVLFTLRKSYPGVHSSQISFPGGKLEAIDGSFLDAAWRETQEEIGVTRDHLELAGALSPIYIPPSNFYVKPFVALAHQPLQLKAQASEVEVIYRLPLRELMHPNTLQQTKVSVNRGALLQVPAFVWQELTIWGATAMMLNELLVVLRD